PRRRDGPRQTPARRAGEGTLSPPRGHAPAVGGRTASHLRGSPTMNLPAFLYALRWLIRDTFRLASASGLLAVMLVVTAVCVLFCLSIGFSGGEPLADPGGPVEFLPGDSEVPENTGVVTVEGRMSIGFGAFEVGLTRDRVNAVRYVQMLLTGWVADTAG